jgi:hypothetical protein
VPVGHVHAPFEHSGRFATSVHDAPPAVAAPFMTTQVGTAVSQMSLSVAAIRVMASAA